VGGGAKRGHVELKTLSKFVTTRGCGENARGGGTHRKTNEERVHRESKKSACQPADYKLASDDPNRF